MYFNVVYIMTYNLTMYYVTRNRNWFFLDMHESYLPSYDGYDDQSVQDHCNI